MAGELALSARAIFIKDRASARMAEGVTVDVAGDAYTQGVQTIGTSEEELVQGADLGTPGYVFILNMDSTNFVEVGSTTGVYTIKILAGKFSIWQHNSSTIYIKADTSAVKVDYLIIEL